MNIPESMLVSKGLTDAKGFQTPSPVSKSDISVTTSDTEEVVEVQMDRKSERELKIFNFFKRVFNLNESSYDANQSVLQAIVVTILSVPSACLLAFGLYLCYKFFGIGNWYHVIPCGVAVTIACISLLVSNLLGRVMKKSFSQKWHNAVLTFMYDFIFFPSILFSFGSFLETGPLIYLVSLGCIVVSSSEGMNAFRLVCYVVLNISVCVAYIVVQFIVTIARNQTVSFTRADQLVLLSIYSFVFLLQTLFCFLNHFALVAKYRSYKNMITELCFSISSLEFESERVRKIISRPMEITPLSILPLKKILLVLMEYKSYLPMNLVNQEDFTDDSSGSTMSSTESKSDSVWTGLSGSSGSSVSSIPEQLITEEIYERFATFMLVRFKGWEDMFRDRSFPTGSLSGALKFLVNACWKILVKKHHGVVLSIQNGEILVSWNLKNITVEHEHRALKAAREFINYSNTLMKSNNTHVNVSIISTNCTAGNAGGEHCKSFHYFSPDLAFLHVMNKLAEKAEDTSVVLMCARTREVCHYHYHCHFVNYVNFGGKEMGVFLGWKKKKKTEGEWMYEIENELLGEEKLFSPGLRVKESFDESQFLKAKFNLEDLQSQLPMTVWPLFKALEEKINSVGSVNVSKNERKK